KAQRPPAMRQLAAPPTESACAPDKWAVALAHRRYTRIVDWASPADELRRDRNCRYFGVAMTRAIHVFRSPDRFVAGTVGQPGNRTFYLQAVHDKRVISVVLEKQQVAVLAERIAALLLEINRRFGTPVPPETAEVEDLSPLITPVDAEF